MINDQPDTLSAKQIQTLIHQDVVSQLHSRCRRNNACDDEQQEEGIEKIGSFSIYRDHTFTFDFTMHQAAMVIPSQISPAKIF